MFPFDAAALPQLTTRKALIIVDFQHDFLASDGALPVTEPAGFVARTIQLAAAFRDSADIIWVKSDPKQHNELDTEQIIISDEAPHSPDRVPARKAFRRALEARTESKALVSTTEAVDEEAFLSQKKPSCLASSIGADLARDVKSALAKTDAIITKLHYSAFKNTQLLLMLRAKMAIEVFICGSLTNVGLYATAMDAAGHGLSITIVEDCCGYRSMTRKKMALEKLAEFTGCEITSAKEALKLVGVSSPRPSPKPDSAQTSDTDGRGRTSEPPDLIQAMSELQLSSEGRSDVVLTATNESLDSLDEPSESKPTSKPSVAAGEADLQAAALPPPPNPPECSRAMGSSSESSLINSHDSDGKRNDLKNENYSISDETKEKATMAAPQFDLKEHQPAEGEKVLSTLHDGLGEGDTDVLENILPKELEHNVFDTLAQEVSWQRMSHQGGEVPRLVAVQGQISEDGSIPIYRHPSDEAPPLLPFSPTVLAIKEETEKAVGHPLNHVLIQFYRDGNDYISEHSDKTLDIVKNSYIANVSLGAERTMVLRTKRMDKDPSLTEQLGEDSKKRRIQRAKLPHNSLFRMGLKTNMSWLHSIRQDKRAEREKTAQELAYAGQRISLTFRHIGTFLSSDEALIWGQGAMGKAKADAKPVINGQSQEAVNMLKAFGTENHSSKFSWEASYGQGFDVLHMSNSPRFFASSDSVVNMRITLMLAEFDINHAKGSMGGPQVNQQDESEGVLVKYVDNDGFKSVVEGGVAIMLYLDALYGSRAKKDIPDRVLLAKQYTLFQRGLGFLSFARRAVAGLSPAAEHDNKLLKQELGFWNSHATNTHDAFLTASEPSLPDFAVWPVLHYLVAERGQEVFDGFEPLGYYYEAFKARECAVKMIGTPEGT